MGKEVLVIALGVWTAVLPFLGFPNRWDTYILAFTGISIVALGIFLHRSALRRYRRRMERLSAYESTRTATAHNDEDANGAHGYGKAA